MAISTFNYPSGKPSVQDSLWHAAISDASGLTNFKYVFDVYNNAGEQLIRAKVYPDVNDGWGYFDAGSVVRNEVIFDWFTVNDNFNMYDLTTNENIIPFTVEVGEEYNVGASGVINIDLARNTMNAYNYIPGVFNRGQINLNNYIGKLLTNRPNYGYTNSGEKLLAGYYGSGSVYVEIETYTSAGIYDNDSNTISVSGDFHQFDLGIKGMENLFGVGFVNPAIHDYYIVKINSRPFRVDLKCIRDYPPINLHFMNAFGVFDTARFDCTNKLAMTANRKKYERKDVTFSGGSVSYYDTVGSSKIYNETGINYAQDLMWTYKLMMNFPTDAEWQWLAELVHSPLIYMAIDGQYFPITIKTSNYDYNKQIWAKLKTFELEIEVNQKRQGFRR